MTEKEPAPAHFTYLWELGLLRLLWGRSQGCYGMTSSVGAPRVVLGRHSCSVRHWVSVDLSERLIRSTANIDKLWKWIHGCRDISIPIKQATGSQSDRFLLVFFCFLWKPSFLLSLPCPVLSGPSRVASWSQLQQGCLCNSCILFNYNQNCLQYPNLSGSQLVAGANKSQTTYCICTLKQPHLQVTERGTWNSGWGPSRV